MRVESDLEGTLLGSFSIGMFWLLSAFFVLFSGQSSSRSSRRVNVVELPPIIEVRKLLAIKFHRNGGASNFVGSITLIGADALTAQVRVRRYSGTAGYG